MMAEFHNGCKCRAEKRDSLFKVKYKWYENTKVKVFAVKNSDEGEVEFLIFDVDEWKWVLASDYEPLFHESE